MPPVHMGSQATVPANSPASTAFTAESMPSMPTTGTVPASPFWRSASSAPMPMPSLAANTPLISSPKRVIQACMTSKAFCSFQSAGWKSRSFTLPPESAMAWSRPILRSMAGTLERMPPIATMPPSPPIALKSSWAIAFEVGTPSKDMCAT
jgi:hypothetical protein